MTDGAPHELTPLAQGVFAWLGRPARHGHPNAGVVIDADAVTVIDALCTPAQADRLLAVVDSWGMRVRRTVLTGDHIDFVGGTSRFTMSGMYGSRATSAHLDQPARPEVYRRLLPDLADQFDDELTTRPVSHLVVQPADLTPAVSLLPTGGQSATNLVALVPESDVLFAGAMCSFGVTPLAFDGDPAAWADALDDLVGLAGRIVPGHGPVGGEAEVRDLQAYLRACVAADGDPAGLGPGPWDGWADRHWDEVNVERAALLAAGDRSIPPSMLRAAGLA